MKILIKVNIGIKVSYLKLKQNSFEILCEEENVKIITVGEFKVVQIFRLRKYSFYEYPLASEAGSGDAEPGGSGQEGRVCQGLYQVHLLIQNPYCHL